MIYAVLLALVALTGYIYCHSNKQQAKKLAWHAKHGGLYYRYAAYGFLATIVGYFVFLLTYTFRPDRVVVIGQWLASPIEASMPGSGPTVHLILGTTITSTAIAFFSGKVANWRAKRNRSKAIYKEITETEDSFSRVMLLAMDHRQTVMVTLDDNKVYIGYPVEFYSPYLDHSWVQILPVMSGYRTPKRKELKLTTDYTLSLHEFYERKIDKLLEDSLKKGYFEPRLDDFAQTIKLDRIQSFTIFDLSHYVDTVAHESGPNVKTGGI